MSKSEKHAEPAEPVRTPVTAKSLDTSDMWDTSQVDPAVEEKLVARQVIATVHVKKPRGGQWVFIHPFNESAPNPQEAWCRRVWINEESSAMEKECWLLDAKLIPDLTPEIPKARLIIAYAVLHGGVCLWPLASPEGSANTYIETALEAAKNYNGKWIKLVSNRKDAAWDVYERQIPTAPPIWPEGGFKYLFETAFRNRHIKDLSHPLMIEKRGKA